jgi:hypothetical protein
MLFQTSTKRAAGHCAASWPSSLSVVNRSVLPSGIASPGPYPVMLLSLSDREGCHRFFLLAAACGNDIHRSGSNMKAS